MWECCATAMTKKRVKVCLNSLVHGSVRFGSVNQISAKRPFTKRILKNFNKQNHFGRHKETEKREKSKTDGHSADPFDNRKFVM